MSSPSFPNPKGRGLDYDDDKKEAASTLQTLQGLTGATGTTRESPDEAGRMRALAAAIARETDPTVRAVLMEALMGSRGG